MISSLKFIEKTIQNFLESGRSPDFFIFAVLLIFAVSKFLVHGDVFLIHLEEFDKIRFAVNPIEIADFYPWSGEQSLFFGHPGLMNLSYWCFQFLAGNDLESVRLFCLIMSTSLLGVFYLLLKKWVNTSTAFFACLAFLSLPMFQVQSIVFFNELGSFTLALLGVHFFLQKRYFSYALLASLAFLYLESSIAYSLAIFLLAGGCSREHFKSRGILRWVAMMTPFLVVALFFCLRELSGVDSYEHNTEALVLRRLFQPWLIFQEIHWGNLARARAYTFLENLGWIFSPVVLFGGLVPFIWREKFQPPRVLYYLLVAGLLQLIFFSLFSTEEGGRDFFSGYLVLFSGLFFCFSRLPKGKTFSLAVLILLCVVSVVKLNTPQISWFHTKLEDYHSFKVRVSGLKTAIEGLGEQDLKCSPRLGHLNSLFCTDFFAIRPDNIQIVSKRRESNFSLLKRGDTLGMNKLLRYHTIKKTIDLGTFFPEGVQGIWLEEDLEGLRK